MPPRKLVCPIAVERLFIGTANWARSFNFTKILVSYVKTVSCLLLKRQWDTGEFFIGTSISAFEVNSIVASKSLHFSNKAEADYISNFRTPKASFMCIHNRITLPVIDHLKNYSDIKINI